MISKFLGECISKIIIFITLVPNLKFNNRLVSIYETFLYVTTERKTHLERINRIFTTTNNRNNCQCLFHITIVFTRKTTINNTEDEQTTVTYDVSILSLRSCHIATIQIIYQWRFIRMNRYFSNFFSSIVLRFHTECSRKQTFKFQKWLNSTSQRFTGKSFHNFSIFIYMNLFSNNSYYRHYIFFKIQYMHRVNFRLQYRYYLYRFLKLLKLFFEEQTKGSWNWIQITNEIGNISSNNVHTENWPNNG